MNLDNSNSETEQQQEKTPPRVVKKLKRFTSYNSDWGKDPNFKSWLQKQNDTEAKCNLCRVTVSVKYEGIHSLSKHAKSSKHKSAESSLKESRLISSFCVRSNSLDELAVIKPEVSCVYHNVRHSISYSSGDCLHRMIPKLFSDSKLATKINCGRTESTAIVSNVLGPESEKRLREKLQISPYFSVASDASNKGNIKMYPYAVQYFDNQEGISLCLLDFYEDPKEKSCDIFDQIKTITFKNGLKFSQVSSYSADNANVNYGAHNSVYQKMQIENSSIVAANCKCHAIHNAIKNSSWCFSYDIQALVHSVYAEFSSSAANCELLKEFCEFAELEYHKILRDVPTRWLSLLPAIDRLLLVWPALKSYFLSQGKTACPPTIWNFIGINADDATEEGLPECYLYFLHNVMQTTQKTIRQLESEKCTSTEIYDIMKSFLSNIENRKEDQFYGSKALSILKLLPKAQATKFKNEADTFFQLVIDYVKKYFDFSENSVFKVMGILSLKNTNFSITYDQLVQLATRFTINVNQDQLYADFADLRSNYQGLINCSSVEEKWLKFFETNEAPELFKIVSFVLSIFVSNAYAERIFSLMKTAWRDARNCLGREQLKAELQIRLNFKFSCLEFFDFLSLSENHNLLKCARSSEKYSHHQSSSQKNP